MKYAKWMAIVAFAAIAATGEAQDKQLVILHTNDTHSTIEQLNPNLANKDLAGRGGYIRRLELLRQQRQQHPDLLYFDSGDFSQGSPFQGRRGNRADEPNGHRRRHHRQP